MAKRNEPYHYCIVESYYPESTAGLHGPIHSGPWLVRSFQPICTSSAAKTL